MRIQLLSDLHLETESFAPEPNPAAELLEPGVVKVVEGNRFTIGELFLAWSRVHRGYEMLAELAAARGLRAHVSVTDETDYAASFVVVETRENR